MPTTALDRTRLANILGLLASPHAGERDAAGLAAHRLVQHHGLTWRDVLGIGKAKAHPASIDWRADLNLCMARLRSLSSWEAEFALSLTGRRRTLTPTQLEKLAQIAARLRMDSRTG